jgi:hypothetical protein
LRFQFPFVLFAHYGTKGLAMTDKMRWRYGDTNPVVAAADADTVVEIGDLLWQDIDDAKPASAIQPGTNTQEVFASKFLGIAMQRSRQGETAPIRVATTGVFELDADNETFELGDYVTPGYADQEHLANQYALSTIQAKEAIGRVARRAAHATNAVLVDIRSTIMTGGIVPR